MIMPPFAKETAMNIIQLRSHTLKGYVGTFLFVMVLCVHSFGQDAPKSADEIARELSNPNTALASMTFKNQSRFYDGLLPGSDEE